MNFIGTPRRSFDIPVCSYTFTSPLIPCAVTYVQCISLSSLFFPSVRSRRFEIRARQYFRCAMRAASARFELPLGTERMRRRGALYLKKGKKHCETEQKNNNGETFYITGVYL